MKDEDELRAPKHRLLAFGVWRRREEASSVDFLSYFERNQV